MDVQQQAIQALSCMDLTSLNAQDNAASIGKLCQQASIGPVPPAAICVYPQFIEQVKKCLAELALSTVKVATVTNFPDGNSEVEQVVAQTTQAVAAGADEIDLVFPYSSLLAGDVDTGARMVEQVKAACGNRLLKVILETGALVQPELIKQATQIALEAGADFIKTSTGKISVHATPPATGAILEAIDAYLTHKKAQQLPVPVIGLKVSGGITHFQNAQAYMQQAQEMMGADWVQPAHFRIGASSLLKDLLAVSQQDCNA